jgi:hypothetical protein
MKDLSGNRGASALVLSGELTEGVSDLSQAWTAPGSVPAMREVNQDRSHPNAPLIEEQPRAHYRRIVESGTSQPGGGTWRTVSPDGREGHMPSPGPATKIATATREEATAAAQAARDNRTDKSEQPRS